MDKREVDYNEDNKLVVSNKYIRAIHPDRMNLNAMKLFRLAITQSQMRDDKFYTYEFKISDLSQIIGIDSSNIYKDTETMCINLMQMLLKIGSGTKDSWELKHIFETCRYEAGSGVITIQLHRDMSDLFLQLKSNFTRIPISTMLMMKSKYAIRVYELICEKLMSHYPYADVCTNIQITLEEAREITSTTKKKTYDQISNFKNKVWLPAIREIEECADWKIIQKDMKKSRRITGFDLTIWDRNGYEVIERCKREGKLPPQKNTDDIPGQMSLFDYWV